VLPLASLDVAHYAVAKSNDAWSEFALNQQDIGVIYADIQYSGR